MSEDRHEAEVDAHSGTETTGHEWDGIKELDTPLPRWWLWIFYATIAWSVVYMIFMPAWPAPPGIEGHTRGLRDHSERANVAVAMEELEASRAPMYARLEGASIADIQEDPELFAFVRNAGESIFGDRCATCHGRGAQGFVGYPNLNDDVWIWGGSYEDIRHTLVVGIRAEHPETRMSMMPRYGADGLLERGQIDQVTDYVLTLSGRASYTPELREGRRIYREQCVSCHGVDGSGDRAQGAPNLTDNEWLYGETRDQIRATIYRGPYGVMPAWEGQLDANQITALAAYVHTLGGGEDAG
jgi:cytochrome c oxidase cbb3-type subunit 3